MFIKDPGSILVVQLAGMGDMVIAIPALLALKKLYPCVAIRVLTNTRAKEILNGINEVDEIFVCDTIKDFLVLMPILRAQRFGMAINLYRIYSFIGALKMFALFIAIGARYWVGRDTNGRGFFYHLKVRETLPDELHEVEHKLNCIRALGSDVRIPEFKVVCKREDEDYISSLLRREGLMEGDLLVGINCATFDPGRNWPVQAYALLAERLSSISGCRVAFSARTTDRQLFRNIKDHLKVDVIDLVGSLSVGQLIAFIKRCSVFVSPDSGPMHIAAALKIPLVALFADGEYSELRPFGRQEHMRIIRGPVKSIKADEVFSYVEELASR